MKIKKITLSKFKRFTDLTITEIPETAKLILLVGPNGSGKTSLFEAFNYWYRLNRFSTVGKQDYFEKKGTVTLQGQWYQDKVKIEFHNEQDIQPESLKGRFYFRTAYRNESDFTISTLNNQSDPNEVSKFETLNGNDITVSENYQRLVSQTLSGVFESSNDSKTISQLRDELIGKIKESMRSIFEDLNVSSIGNPLENGSFYFVKGSSHDFHYKNLSAGEKSVFDLVLDMMIKSIYYGNTIYCIDEPEAHMHTRLQGKVLKELYRLTPENSQLWISTHSIGMLKQAQELELLSPGSVVFLDFDNRDFDLTENIFPVRIDKTIWDRFLDLALADFAQLVSPETIVFCEGSSQGRKYKDFDAQIYGNIFRLKHFRASFNSIGSSSEIENLENGGIKVVSKILGSSNMIRFVDRDNKSIQEVAELKLKGIKTSKRRNIEGYLLDDELIIKLCETRGKSELILQCLEAKNRAIEGSILRGNPSDDMKSASGELYTALCKILDLTQSGNNKCAFLRDTMAPLVTENTAIFFELENEIFH